MKRCWQVAVCVFISLLSPRLSSAAPQVQPIDWVKVEKRHNPADCPEHDATCYHGDALLRAQRPMNKPDANAECGDNNEREYRA